MARLDVYDPPMCCSSGVCGAEPDERLAMFAADLDWLARCGVEVHRHNLAHTPTEFTAQPRVLEIVERTGGAGLPAGMLDGRVVFEGEYPSRERLAELTGAGDLTTVPPVSDPASNAPCCGGDPGCC